MILSRVLRRSGVTSGSIVKRWQIDACLLADGAACRKLTGGLKTTITSYCVIF